jgi:signal transduction histidine kinase
VPAGVLVPVRLKPETNDILDGMVNFVRMAENERRLLAAELHDQLLCDLREVSLIVRRLQMSAAELSVPGSFQKNLERIIERLNGAADEARRVMENLRPSILDSFGIYPALEGCLRGVAQTSDPVFSPRMVLKVKEEELGLNEEELLALYRILQEGITNVSRHARALNVELSSFRRETNLVVRLADDGVGPAGIVNKQSGRGIDNMRFRARLIGADIQWLPNTPCGTIVEIRFQGKESE